MSMTREEAIKSLQNIIEYWTYKPTEVEAAKMAIAALTPPNEWVSVEERLPEDEARQYIEDELDGIGYLYPCLHRMTAARRRERRTHDKNDAQRRN